MEWTNINGVFDSRHIDLRLLGVVSYDLDCRRVGLCPAVLVCTAIRAEPAGFLELLATLPAEHQCLPPSVCSEPEGLQYGRLHAFITVGVAFLVDHRRFRRLTQHAVVVSTVKISRVEALSASPGPSRSASGADGLCKPLMLSD